MHVNVHKAGAKAHVLGFHRLIPRLQIIVIRYRKNPVFFHNNLRIAHGIGQDDASPANHSPRTNTLFIDAVPAVSSVCIIYHSTRTCKQAGNVYTDLQRAKSL